MHLPREQPSDLERWLGRRGCSLQLEWRDPEPGWITQWQWHDNIRCKSSLQVLYIWSNFDYTQGVSVEYNYWIANNSPSLILGLVRNLILRSSCIYILFRVRILITSKPHLTHLVWRNLTAQMMPKDFLVLTVTSFDINQRQNVERTNYESTGKPVLPSPMVSRSGYWTLAPSSASPLGFCKDKDITLTGLPYNSDMQYCSTELSIRLYR